MNVLLVDDAATTRTILKLMLEANGFSVYDASDGEEALALARLHSFDVLVTDVYMGGMDGVSLAMKLKQIRPDLPVLFISGGFLETELESLKLARSAFLLKPFLPSELVTAVVELTAAGNSAADAKAS